jgi:hypothetical protein
VGVVTQNYPDAEFAERSRAFAKNLALGQTRAHAAMKAIFRAHKEDGVRGRRARAVDVGALFATSDLAGAVESS